MKYKVGDWVKIISQSRSNLINYFIAGNVGRIVKVYEGEFYKVYFPQKNIDDYFTINHNQILYKLESSYRLVVKISLKQMKNEI